MRGGRPPLRGAALWWHVASLLVEGPGTLITNCRAGGGFVLFRRRSARWWGTDPHPRHRDSFIAATRWHHGTSILQELARQPMELAAGSRDRAQLAVDAAGDTQQQNPQTIGENVGWLMRMNDWGAEGRGEGILAGAREHASPLRPSSWRAVSFVGRP